jgi:hypothetical protein
VSRWDVSQVQNMKCLFCALPFNVTGYEQWDVRKVTCMDHMFAYSDVQLEPEQFAHWRCAALTSATDFAVDFVDSIRNMILQQLT